MMQGAKDVDEFVLDSVRPDNQSRLINISTSIQQPLTTNRDNDKKPKPNYQKQQRWSVVLHIGTMLTIFVIALARVVQSDAFA